MYILCTSGLIIDVVTLAGSQLLEIQRRFQAADVSGSRIGIRVAQRKLALWDELSMRLDETVEESMVRRLNYLIGSS